MNNLGSNGGQPVRRLARDDALPPGTWKPMREGHTWRAILACPFCGETGMPPARWITPEGVLQLEAICLYAFGTPIERGCARSIGPALLEGYRELRIRGLRR